MKFLFVIGDHQKPDWHSCRKCPETGTADRRHPRRKLPSYQHQAILTTGPACGPVVPARQAYSHCASVGKSQVAKPARALIRPTNEVISFQISDCTGRMPVSGKCVSALGLLSMTCSQALGYLIDTDVERLGQGHFVLSLQILISSALSLRRSHHERSCRDQPHQHLRGSVYIVRDTTGNSLGVGRIRDRFEWR